MDVEDAAEAVTQNRLYNGGDFKPSETVISDAIVYYDKLTKCSRARNIALYFTGGDAADEGNPSR